MRVKLKELKEFQLESLCDHGSPVPGSFVFNVHKGVNQLDSVGEEQDRVEEKGWDKRNGLAHHSGHESGCDFSLINGKQVEEFVVFGSIDLDCHGLGVHLEAKEELVGFGTNNLVIIDHEAQFLEEFDGVDVSFDIGRMRFLVDVETIINIELPEERKNQYLNEIFEGRK